MIDDAIVVLENIFKFAEEKGLSPIDAAIQGTRDIGLAVMATTLSLIIIFIPVALMGGIVGHFMSSFGYTAAFAIGVSLIVSFTLTPMLCSRFLKPSANGGHTKDTAVFRAFAAPYRSMLRWSMSAVTGPHCPRYSEEIIRARRWDSRWISRCTTGWRRRNSPKRRFPKSD